MKRRNEASVGVYGGKEGCECERVRKLKDSVGVGELVLKMV